MLALWRKMQRWPAGAWLFSRAVCFKAPYFSTIHPRFEVLEAGRCEASIPHRRSMQNHLGTVHAIALCNLAELVAGVMTDASLPRDMRWIPKGMTVAYLAKANGRLLGVATPEIPIVSAQRGYELPVSVSIANAAAETVFTARIAMWVSPRPSR